MKYLFGNLLCLCGASGFFYYIYVYKIDVPQILWLTAVIFAVGIGNKFITNSQKKKSVGISINGKKIQ